MTVGDVTIIKKYGNRRLYDTGDSRYITLSELAAKIQDGADVRVLEAKTGEDLTQATLTQIIIEGRDAARMLPVGLLTQLIRLGDDALAEFFGQYMSAALGLYLQAKRGANAIAALNPFAAVPFAATDAFARMWGGAPFAGAPPPWSPPPQPLGVDPRHAEPEPAAPARGRAAGRRDPQRDDDRVPDDGADDSADDTLGRDDVASLRRELEELKQMIREVNPARSAPEDGKPAAVPATKSAGPVKRSRKRRKSPAGD